MIDSSVLSQYSLFDGLEQKQIDSILPLMEQEVYDAGTEIIIEGDRNSKIHFIVEGRVAVIKNKVLLDELGEGIFFGEMEVLDILPVEATIKAMVTTRAMTLSIDALGDIYENDLQTYSFIVMNLARDISRRLRNMNNIVAKESPPMDWN